MEILIFNQQVTDEKVGQGLILLLALITVLALLPGSAGCSLSLDMDKFLYFAGVVACACGKADCSSLQLRGVVNGLSKLSNHAVGKVQEQEGQFAHR